jgi:hypothetical protein
MSVKQALWIGATLMVAACSSTTEPNVVQAGGSTPGSGTATECAPVSPRAPLLRASAEQPRCKPAELGIKTLPR